MIRKMVDVELISSGGICPHCVPVFV